MIITKHFFPYSFFFTLFVASASLLSAADWTAEIDQADALFGYSIRSAGDVNGDGWGDVIVGARDYTDSLSNEGGAFVYLGSSTGLSTSSDWSAVGGQLNAEFGRSVSAAGDVNGDGYADVIVGAHSYDNGEGDQGRVYAYYGSSSGLSATADWTVAEVDMANASFGWEVSAAGDVNGDGYSDVVVGSPYYGNGESQEGALFVYHGGPAGLSSSADWSYESNVASALLGYSVCFAGDLNGDGYSDIVAGAPYYGNVQSYEGQALVFLGGSTGLSSSPDWSYESNQGGAVLGWSSSTAGDVNGDGYADLIVGAYGYDNGESGEGAAFLFLGSASGPSVSPDWHGEPNVASSAFGYSVATAGDVNGDGYADVLVGANSYDETQNNEGRVFLYHGSASGLSTTEDWAYSSGQQDAYLGHRVATAGDVDGDGLSDLLASAQGYDNGETNEGLVYLWLGSHHNFSYGSSPDVIIQSSNSYKQFGYQMTSTGDIDGDGYRELLIMQNTYSGGFQNEGAVYLHKGTSSGLELSPSWTYTGGEADAKLGSRPAKGGDINGDGYDDVVFAGAGYREPERRSGKVFSFYGKPAGLSTNPDFTMGPVEDRQESFGCPIHTVEDYNRDGFGDTVSYYWSSYFNKDVFQIYEGSQTGPSASYAWSNSEPLSGEKMGNTKPASGDFNGDGYIDLVFANRDWGFTQGRAYIFYGSASGFGSSADLTVDGENANDEFGHSIAADGDLNGDGYDDLLIGAHLNDSGASNAGAVYAYHGSATGLSATPDWSFTGVGENEFFGFAVCFVPDANFDDCDEVATSAYAYTNGQNDEGGVFIFKGSPSGLSTSPEWSWESDQANARGGIALAGDDFNNDGRGDLAISADQFDNGDGTLGRVFVFLGRGENPLDYSANMRQRKADDSGPIAPRNILQTSQFHIAANARTPFGRADVGLHWEVKPLTSAFDGTDTGKTNTVDSGLNGATVNELVGNGLLGGQDYHWRARILYDPVTYPYQVGGPWYSPSAAKFRTHSSVPVELDMFMVE